MSREHNDELDAMRYATDAWRRTREELLSRPTFCVQGIIDKCQPQISDMIEKGLKRQLLEGIEAVLCDGEYHVVKIERQEEVWNDYNRCKKSTGRNHRKKDRAKARRLRAERKKLAARLRA